MFALQENFKGLRMQDSLGSNLGLFLMTGFFQVKKKKVSNFEMELGQRSTSVPQYSFKLIIPEFRFKPLVCNSKKKKRKKERKKRKEKLESCLIGLFKHLSGHELRILSLLLRILVVLTHRSYRQHKIDRDLSQK